MNKFILGENPQAASSGGLWIIKLPKPIAIIEVVHDSEKIHTKNAIYTHNFIYINTDGITENWQLRLYHYFSEDFNQTNTSELVDKLFNDAKHWFISYLKWEDGNIDVDDFAKNN